MPRKITVATVSLRGDGGTPTVERNLAAAERRLEYAAAVKPDIVCLPEYFSLLGVSAPDKAKAAEPVPGPTTERIGAVARRFGNMAKYHAIVAKYGRRVGLHVLSPEGAFTLESHDPAVTVTDIVREFDLETQHDYFARSTARQDATRPGAR